MVIFFFVLFFDSFKDVASTSHGTWLVTSAGGQLAHSNLSVVFGGPAARGVASLIVLSPGRRELACLVHC